MPLLRCCDCDLIVFAVMRLLIKYAYTTESDYGKFTICYAMKIPAGDVSFTISNSITFRVDGKDFPVYTLIDQLVKKKAEDYNDAELTNIETFILNNVHVPYAVGFLVVRPGDDLSPKSKAGNGIETYFNEDYPDIVFETFEERSNEMLFDFIECLVVVVRQNPSIQTVYFHNFSQFNGVLLLKYLATNGEKYTIKPLMRNHMLYELVVYLDNKLLFRLRDSLTLLTGSLNNLARNLCTQLGFKGSVPHDEVQVSNLKNLRTQLLEYVKQDIRLLGGVMLKAQEIYWTQNEDTFIHRGYYGGHADAYKPYGKNLYYYYVNSLYPHIMRSYPMPGGKLVWLGNLEGQDLDNLFGFIEAYIVCPRNTTRPSLPYRDDKNQTLHFPTGYLFEKMPSRFGGFVSSLFKKRQEAKRTGNNAMSYVYKILMNSLYGRFGINPKSTITEICDLDRYLVKKNDFIFGDKLNKHYYIVSYLSNTKLVPDSEWSPPRMSAVQLAAAITACTRIHMYPYISRDDSYYTDTDSVILSNPLPEEVVSSTVLGKFKLEYIAKKGIFLAPKSYYILTQEGDKIIKHNGLAKSLERLNITKKETLVNLGIRISNKREPVFDNDLWMDTVPLDVTYFACQERRIRTYEVRRLQELNEINKEHIAQKDRIISDLESKIAILTSERELENHQSKLNSIKNPSQDKSKLGKSQSHSAHKADDPKKPTYKQPPKAKLDRFMLWRASAKASFGLALSGTIHYTLKIAKVNKVQCEGFTLRPFNQLGLLSSFEHDSGEGLVHLTQDRRTKCPTIQKSLKSLSSSSARIEVSKGHYATPRCYHLNSFVRGEYNVSTTTPASPVESIASGEPKAFYAVHQLSEPQELFSHQKLKQQNREKDQSLSLRAFQLNLAVVVLPLFPTELKICIH
ncbi:hypothetical protein FNV43_RR24575 [Rhamnella rubrinervis]|uniref:DNA-directed DNA polymerase n=1 Tax=Rhamnella rubrinervis TaxID=2594499 RepID=A0A8K0DSP3_9ROSA|nr:hypothetical protein FNV43_RR24575 [Rhamnella rubrinervis]